MSTGTTSATRKPVTVERTIGEKTISVETGRLAKQASGAVVVRIGETMTLVATVSGPGREGLDFFPLTVDYREKVYAAGKFPGGFIKREGRPSTKEILTSRLIDRPLRPLFPAGYRDEVQIQAGPISADRLNDPDVISILGASASLILAPHVPFFGPIGAVRLGRIGETLVPFPTAAEMADSDLDLIVASTDKAIVMIEGFGHELPEPEMFAAIMEAHRLNQDLIALQHELREAAGLPPITHPQVQPDPLFQTLEDRFAHDLREAMSIHGKLDRKAAAKELLKRILAEFCPEGVDAPVKPNQVKSAFHQLEEKVVRSLILDGNRPDGRGPKDLRPISCEVGLLPRAHGSAIFQRGETQALVTTVLGTGADEQRVDGIMEEYKKKFMLDYNMPSFAVGEVRPIRGPGRREIGHGALAERSVAPVLPPPARVPLHDPRRQRHPGVQRLQLDGLRLRRDPRPDGRRRPDQRPGRRHLDRPRPGRGVGQVRPADRHRRRRGPLRRHGLQGRRHPARRHRHPARPQEPGDHRADRQGDPRPGPRGPPRNPPHDAPRRSSAPARRSPPTPRG